MRSPRTQPVAFVLVALASLAAMLYPPVPSTAHPLDRANGASNPTAANSTSYATAATAAFGMNAGIFDWGTCTWWVAQMRYVPWEGNAIEWYGNAQRLGFAVGWTPVPGAIMVRTSPMTSAGHVAYVESVRGTQFTVSEANITTLGVVTTRTYDTVSNPTPGLLGFIYWPSGATYYYEDEEDYESGYAEDDEYYEDDYYDEDYYEEEPYEDEWYDDEYYGDE